jgi:hypothetical protein
VINLPNSSLITVEVLAVNATGHTGVPSVITFVTP